MKSYEAFSIGGGNHKMYKGHRIRAGDQHLVYHFVLGWLLALFIGWMSVFYFQELRQFDISKLSLSTIEIVRSIKDLIYLLGSLVLSGSTMLLYIHFFRIIGAVCGIDKS